jgi:hypothetical protein
METVENPELKDRLGVAPFVLSGLSFIPLVGAPLGIICVLWGLVTKKSGGRKLAGIGAAGIAFTVALFGALFYFGFVQRGGVYDDLRKRLAQSELNSLVPVIETYKLQFGRYPETLDDVKERLPKETFETIYDPRYVGQKRKFYYERVGDDHYYLRGVGPAGVPFSKDDIAPQIPTAPGGKLGLLTERQSQP